MFGLGGKLTIGLGVIVLVMAAAFFIYFKYSQGRIEDMSSRLGEFEQAVETQEQTIAAMEERVRVANVATERLTRRFEEIREETTKLSKTLSRHDLGYLAGQKPGLIERRVNSATEDVLDDLEEITKPVGPEGDE